jgi:FAD/FMN-containing dehydrogenase
VVSIATAIVYLRGLSVQGAVRRGSQLMKLVESLRETIGTPHVLTDADSMAPYLMDFRERLQGRAQAVVRPHSTDEVARIVRACGAAGVPIVPQGGNTGLVGGATPDDSGNAIVLSLARMQRVRAVDTQNDTITVEAGCILQNVQQVAAEHGRLFPLSLAAEGSATIGGNLSTNAGGTAVLRYGSTRDLTLGLEVVLADGDVWDGLRGLRKDNTGYDLKSLFVGAEGTLGIITAAVLKLFPLPRAQITALAAVPTISAAVELLTRAKAAAGATLTGFELMSDSCLATVAEQMPRLPQPLRGSAPFFVLIELSDHESEQHASSLLEALLGEAIEAGIALDAVVAKSVQEARQLWALRESIPEAHKKSGGNVKHDISVPVSAIAPFVERTNAALAARFPWIRPLTFGHLGDGNLHYNFGTQPGVPVSTAFAVQDEINRLVHDAVHAAGGSISAEHGLGQTKRDEIVRYHSPVEMRVKRALKQALDPRNLMNPGKLL